MILNGKLTVVMLLTFVSGCGLIPKSVDLPRVSGEWTGEVVLIPVFEQTGKEHVAAALIIQSGPTTPDVFNWGTGKPDVAILVERHADLDRLIDPTTIAPGQRVKISGTMITTSSVFLREATLQFNRKHVPLPAAMDPEFVIVVSQPIKLIER